MKSGRANAARAVQIALSMPVSEQVSKQARYTEDIALLLSPPYGFIDFPLTSCVWPVNWHFL